MTNSEYRQEVARIVRAAGGKFIGRTRLQKTAYLLRLAKVACKGFYFEYRFFGPFSDDLAMAASSASSLIAGFKEERHRAAWGGMYSVYEFHPESPADIGTDNSWSAMESIVKITSKADPNTLEVAATIAWFTEQGEDDPWGTTQARKPQKAVGSRLEKAKALYAKLRETEGGQRLPAIQGCQGSRQAKG